MLHNEVNVVLNLQQSVALAHCLRDDSSSLNLIARAGTGKTYTLIEIASRLPGSAFLGAFSRGIANVLIKRLPKRPNLDANTLHSAALRAWRTSLAGRARLEIDGNKVYTIARRSWAKFDHKVALAAAQLVSYAKQAGLGLYAPYEDLDNWESLIEHYDMEEEIPDTAMIKRRVFLESCVWTYEQSLDWCVGRGSPKGQSYIDYDDMLLAPLHYRVRFPRVDWVLLDECLIGDTPVLMADGTIMPIKQIVESRHPGPVASYNAATKATEAHAITGWHTIPLHGKLLRIVTRRVLRNAKGKRLSALTAYVKFSNRVIICTEDHRIYSGGAWINAKDLRPGDSLIWESHAPKNPHYQDKYKHSPKGRANLAQMMRVKNTAGTCGQAPTPNAKPILRGGNGKGPTAHEKALRERLGDPWVCSYVVPCGNLRAKGYASHYKIDVANPVEKIAIELDGASHKSKNRIAQDRKKDELLTSLGWQVVRMTNQESMALATELLHGIFGNSPVDAEVVEIDEFIPQEPYVYDIDVEQTHCFYANAVLVHNCQDTNETRRHVCMEMIGHGKTGRMLSVGDPKQSIYGFAGATNNAMELIKNYLHAAELPLNVTYRCPKTVVEAVQAYVPDFTAHPDNPEGVMRAVSHQDFWLEHFNPVTDVILCRFTRPLVGIAGVLRDRGLRCVVEGQSGKSYLALANRWGEIKIDSFLELLDEYQERKCTEYATEGRDAKAAALRDRCGTLKTLARGLSSSRTTRDLARLIEFTFKDRAEGDEASDVLRLSTVHRAKGREWDNVFLIGKNAYMPSGWARKDWELEQEDNLIYVGMTRTKKQLVEVEVPEERGEWWEHAE